MPLTGLEGLGVGEKSEQRRTNVRAMSAGAGTARIKSQSGFAAPFGSDVGAFCEENECQRVGSNSFFFLSFFFLKNLSMELSTGGSDTSPTSARESSTRLTPRVFSFLRHRSDVVPTPV